MVVLGIAFSARLKILITDLFPPFKSRYTIYNNPQGRFELYAL